MGGKEGEVVNDYSRCREREKQRKRETVNWEEKVGGKEGDCNVERRGRGCELLQQVQRESDREKGRL